MIGFDDDEPAVNTAGGRAGDITIVGGLEEVYACEGYTDDRRRSSRETKEVARERGWLAALERA